MPDDPEKEWKEYTNRLTVDIEIPLKGFDHSKLEEYDYGYRMPDFMFTDYDPATWGEEENEYKDLYQVWFQVKGRPTNSYEEVTLGLWKAPFTEEDRKANQAYSEKGLPPMLHEIRIDDVLHGV